MDKASPNSMPNRGDIDALLAGFSGEKQVKRARPYETPLADMVDPLTSAKDLFADKSSLQMQYQAEVNVIQSKIGDLESVRNSLGLSRRKMCQLLMVDPSAWTRWSKTQKVPFHIYRSLQWYMALIEKEPAWHPQNSFNRINTIHVENEMALLKSEIKQLKTLMQKSNHRIKKIGLIALAIFFGGYLLGRL